MSIVKLMLKKHQENQLITKETFSRLFHIPIGPRQTKTSTGSECTNGMSCVSLKLHCNTETIYIIYAYTAKDTAIEDINLKSTFAVILLQSAEIMHVIYVFREVFIDLLTQLLHQ